MAMDCMARPAWTPRTTPRLPSPRCSSIVTSPHAIGLMPAQSYPVMSSPTMPSSGSRLTSGQQISARSQYGPITGTTSSSTNRRTAMKRDHCSSVNCSRTEKKSVPRDSPRCSLTCVIAGLLSWPGLAASVRSASRNASTTGAMRSGCAASSRWPPAIDVQLAARYQPVHDPRVGQRDDRVVVAGQDQGRRPQPRQPGQACPSGRRDQLVEVAAGRAQPGRRVQQVTCDRRVCARAAPVQMAGDARRVRGIAVAARREHVQQDLSVARAPSARPARSPPAPGGAPGPGG